MTKGLSHFFIGALIFSFSLIIIEKGYGQIDIGSWTSFSVNMKYTDKMTIKVRPIMRHKSDISEYNNSSIDISWHYKINKKWSAMVLERHFFIPDKNDREFVFFDLTHTSNISKKIGLSNRLRYHLALNLTGIDPDFIRYQPTFSFTGLKKFKPFVGIDIWYRLSTTQEISGSRYIVGSTYTISDKLAINTQIWWQDGYNDIPLFETYLFVATLNYKLDFFNGATPNQASSK